MQKLPKMVPWGRLAELRLSERPDAERIGTKNATLRWDAEVVIKVFSDRKVLARCIRMQQQRESRNTDWRAVIKLKDAEGY